MLRNKLSPDMTFDEASALWLEGRSADENTSGAISPRYIRKNTAISYRQYIESLKLFFTGMKLQEIDAGHIDGYQRARLNGDAPFIRKRRPHLKEAGICPAGPRKVNQELGILKSILVLAGRWDQDMNYLYKPLRIEDADVPRALSPEEQHHWLRTAQSRPQWNVVYWYCLLAFDTCMSTNEIRGLRLGDVNLQQRVLVVPQSVAKNKYRNRTIEPVGANVLWALEKLLERARDIGCVDHQHYLFPFRKGVGPFQPSRPMTSSGIKKPWEEVREASGLHWFRMYDTRHTAITRMAEQGIPIAVIKSFAGHVSNRMNQHYTHVSQSAQRHAREYARPATYANQLRRKQPMLSHQSPERSLVGRYSLEAPKQQLTQRGSAEAWHTLEPHHVIEARETSPPLQAAAVEATSHQESTLSPSIGSAGGFYATSWTW